MRRMKRAARFVVLLLCVAITVAAIANVVIDNTEVRQMAQNTACEAAAQAKGQKPGAAATAKPAAQAPAAPDDCRMTMTMMSRTPLGQSFEYSGGGSTRRIRCTRSLIFAGDYTCTTE
jgi:uncharacterized protein (DUF305 family)